MNIIKHLVVVNDEERKERQQQQQKNKWETAKMYEWLVNKQKISHMMNMYNNVYNNNKILYVYGI